MSENMILATLNLSDEQIDFFRDLPALNCSIEVFNSPEGMVPWLKHVSDVVIIAVCADSLLNHGHNEVEKLLDLFKIEPALSINPVIAVTSDKESVEEIVLERGFASDIIDFNLPKKNTSLKLRNLLLLSRARYKIEMEYLAKHESENRKKFERLQELDKETGIFNREAFCRRTEEMIRSNPEKSFVLVRWDIDRFKIYNDTFGVHAGDALLRAIGKSYIDRNFQSVTYGHWVSDHFVMCMEERLFSSVAVHKYISEQISLYRSDFEFIVRMGVYRITDPNLSVALMCDRALMAMKSIKNDFERRVAFYDESMRGQMMEEQELITDMEPAIQNEDFQIFFQPQYNYASGKMSGAEALVRWFHPTKGVISPAKFIPVFEQNGFICRLDEYIWEHVCMALKKWKDQGYELIPVSVNISRRDIYNPNLVQYLINLVNRYELDPFYLRLEITESAYMEEPAQLIKVVERMKEAGFTIEMDDFGSGYSSLNTLKDVPVDILKLDLKFLSSEGTNKRGGSILTSIVRMANWLNLPIIAEGIENVEQAEFLKTIGCYTMQGFLFSRPIPEDEFLKLMEAADLEMIENEDTPEDLANAVDFLNLSTQNALLFNSFVGGAAIIERDKDEIDAIRINDKFFDTVCISREQYQNTPHQCLGYYAEKYADQFKQMLDEAHDNGRESTCVLHWRPFDGSGKRYWIQYRSRFLASSGHSEIYYVAVENVTQNIHLLHENERINNELTSIIDSVPCGIITMRKEGPGMPQIKFINKGICSIYGYSPVEFEKVFETNCEATFAPGEYEKFVTLLKETIAAKRNSFQTRSVVERKNGTSRLVFVQSVLNYDKDGVDIIIILIDLNQQIEGDVSKFGQILNKVYDEVFEVNYETGSMKFISSNMDFQPKTKDPQSLHEVLTNWIKTYVVEEDRKKTAVLLDIEKINAIQATGEVPHFEYSISINGKIIPVSTTLMQVEKNTYFVCDRRR
ncbi:MAG: EAL domain-containing protein [Treponema sp.]|nr:EAL domain-containing protein [Treponema sp.]